MLNVFVLIYLDNILISMKNKNQNDMKYFKLILKNKYQWSPEVNLKKYRSHFGKASSSLYMLSKTRIRIEQKQIKSVKHGL